VTSEIAADKAADKAADAAAASAPTAEARTTHPWRPRRFMVIAAHPDDAEFGPSGTAARWIAEGSVGWLVCCTSGDQGGEDPDADPLELAALREREQRAAAAVTGYAGVSFLHQPDGALANDLALRELLVREIRTFRPDAVLATDPETLFHGDGGVNHTDHRAAGMAAVDAVYPAARNPMAFPSLVRSGLAAHVVRRLYLFWSNHANAWVDISSTLDRKIAALSEHRSQIRDLDALAERIRAWAAEEGEAIGSAAAESLRVVIIDDDEDEGPSPSDESPADPPTDA
jgi:LmbE family N-acetylglucosaminyl deacetylase